MLLPVFVEHELWRPRERAWIGSAMRAADIARLKSELDHGVRLAQSLGIDVGEVVVPLPTERRLPGSWPDRSSESEPAQPIGGRR